MKAVKKLLTCFLTAALVVGSSTMVFAADSTTASNLPTAVSAQDTADGAIVVEAMTAEDLANVEDGAKATVEAVNADPSMDALVKSLQESGVAGAADAAAALKGYTLLTPIFDTHATGSLVDLAGGYDITYKDLKNLTADAEVVVLHFSTKRATWEVVKATNNGDGTISVHLDDLSPTAIAAKGGSDTGKTVSTSADSTAETSPATGVASTSFAWVLAAVVLAGAAVVVFRKKKVA